MHIHCLIFNNFADWEIGYILPELRRNSCEVTTVGFDHSLITSMGGLQLKPHTTIEDIATDDIRLLIIPGGEAWHDHEHSKELERIIRRCHERNKPIAAICGATILLARLGLLDRIKHTSNSLEYLKHFAPHYTGESYYVDSLAVTDRNIITASGLGSIEFAFEILKLLEIYPEEKCIAWFDAFKRGIIPKTPAYD